MADKDQKEFLDIPGLTHLWGGLKGKLAKKDLSNVDAATGRNALGIKNPDWNQNDPASVDFVKNRTHWIEDLIIPYAQYAVDANYHRAIIEQGGLRDGETYTVTWEGTQYECTAIKQNILYTVLGDDGVVPFKIQSSSSRMYVYPTDTTLTAVNMGIKGPGAYHPLSENFLPVIPVSKGGTGASSVSAAQEALGIGGKRTTRLTIGTSTSGWAAKDCDYLCDGEADEVEINAAINALPEEGGEIVLLDGSYNVAADISIGKEGVAIRGNGQATKLIRAVAGADLLYIRYPGCTVENLYLDGQNLEGCGIYLGSDNNIIRGCTIKGNTSYGIQCWGAHNKIVGNTISTSYTGINVLDDYNVVSNNVVLSNTENGISVQHNHNIVTGNVSRLNAVANLRLMDANYSAVVGNDFSITADDEVTAQYAILLYRTDNNYNIVTENLIGSGTITVDGGTGNITTSAANVTANNFLVGNGPGSMVEKTPNEVLRLIGAIHTGEYGLGSNVTHMNDPNSITENGFYSIEAQEPTTGTSANWYCLHIGYVGGSYQYATQIAFGMYDATQILDGSVKKRYKVRGTWSAWEYVNPPMVSGYEYRTTERYLEKPVYQTTLSFGTLPNNSTKSIKLGQINKMVDFTVIARNPSTGVFVKLPDDGNNPQRACMWFQGNKFYINTNSDLTAYTEVYVTFKYTKTTD